MRSKCSACSSRARCPSTQPREELETTAVATRAPGPARGSRARRAGAPRSRSARACAPSGGRRAASRSSGPASSSSADSAAVAADRADLGEVALDREALPVLGPQLLPGDQLGVSVSRIRPSKSKRSARRAIADKPRRSAPGTAPRDSGRPLPTRQRWRRPVSSEPRRASVDEHPRGDRDRLPPALGAGTINTVVGSGTLLTFPTLLAFGYAPVVANVSNTVGLVPGRSRARIGYRAELAGQRRRALVLGTASALGGAHAARSSCSRSRPRRSRRSSPSSSPSRSSSSSSSRGSRRWLESRRGRQPPPRRALGRRPALFATGVYGGYFGAAQGILLLAALGLGLAGDAAADQRPQERARRADEPGRRASSSSPSPTSTGGRAAARGRLGRSAASSAPGSAGGCLRPRCGR